MTDKFPAKMKSSKIKFNPLCNNADHLNNFHVFVGYFILPLDLEEKTMSFDINYLFINLNFILQST